MGISCAVWHTCAPGPCSQATPLICYLFRWSFKSKYRTLQLFPIVFICVRFCPFLPSGSNSFSHSPHAHVLFANLYICLCLQATDETVEQNRDSRIGVFRCGSDGRGGKRYKVPSPRLGTKWTCMCHLPARSLQESDLMCYQRQHEQEQPC